MSGAEVRTPLAAAAATLLGSLALSPVLTTAAWLRPAVGAVLVVLLTGMALRWAGPLLAARALPERPVPAVVAGLGTVLVPAVQLLALAGYLVQLSGAGGVLPTPERTAELGSVLRSGVAEIQEQVAPAVPVPSLVVLIALYVGVVAVLVDLIAVGAGQGGLAAALLLVPVVVPVVTLGGDVGLLPVVAPAVGMALLLWADQAGRLESTGRTAGPGSAAGGAAVRIGAVAVAVGVLAGGALPILAEGSATGGRGGIGSTGTSLDPVADMYGELMRDEPVDLLEMQTSVLDPGYLRAVTVDRYDAEAGWTMSEPDTLLPLDTRLPSQREEFGRPVTATLTADGHDDRFLPVPASPVSVQIEGGESDWRFDPDSGTVSAEDATTANRRYEVTATEVRPTPEQLQAVPALSEYNAVQQRYTALPALDPEVTEQVDSLVEGIDGGYQRVRAILDFLTDPRNDFTYALSTEPGTSGDDLLDFLRQRRGYCEQYAGAMAVMVRLAGMPARVALGYTPGTRQDDGTFLITSDDAHAWVEVYFNGQGWVPFDPTPIDVGRRADLPWAPRVEVETLPEQAPVDPSEIPPELLDLVPPDVVGAEQGLTDGAFPDVAPVPGAAWPARVGLVLLVAAVAAGPGGLRLLQRRRRLARGTPQALWDELTASADDLGIARQDAWTPRETGRALAGRVGEPETTEAIERLASAEELASYGPGTAAHDAGLASALRTARRGLGGSVDRRTRLRAAFWPASLPAALLAGMPGWARGLPRTSNSRRPGGRRLRADES